MARQPGLWQRARDGMWMTTLGGKQTKLSPDKAEAQRMFYRLMGQDAPKAQPHKIGFRKMADTYLDRTRSDKSDRRHEYQLWQLKCFCEVYGHRDVMSLKTFEVNDWLEKTGWAESTKAQFIASFKAVFNWAIREGYLAESPVPGLRRRKYAKRSRVLLPAERDRVMEAAPPYFRDFLDFIALTGCRPYSEAAKLTADMVDWENGRVILLNHKNAKHGKPRVLYLPTKLLERLKELADERPHGALFRNSVGKEWTRHNGNGFLRRILKRLGLPDGTTYAFRHSWITNSLASGIPVEVVAELCGNSPQMIYEHYNQMDKMSDVLRAAAEKAAK